MAKKEQQLDRPQVAEAFGEGVPAPPPPGRCGTDGDGALCVEVVGPVCFFGGVVTDLFLSEGSYKVQKDCVCSRGAYIFLPRCEECSGCSTVAPTARVNPVGSDARQCKRVEKVQVIQIVWRKNLQFKIAKVFVSISKLSLGKLPGGPGRPMFSREPFSGGGQTIDRILQEDEMVPWQGPSAEGGH